ncbi:MAG: FAD binding domain-containing protein [Bradyrhizobium sp.]|nr:FAD binding domain-containing protein [Bradyrhizobium sp.]
MPMIRMIVALALCLMWPVASLAQDKGVVRVTSDVSYEFLARWDTDRLNKILTIDTPKFASVTVSYTPAVNAVRLYRITYASVVPERGNKPIRATGLLAVPEITETSLPMVSYQHGTVYGKQEVPSFPEQSPETQLMIAQFAGQGHLLIGAARTYADCLAALEEFPGVGALLERLGSLQIRQRGTLGGNIANASPIGDMPPVLLALDAQLRLRRAGAVREVAIDGFFTGYRQTILQPGEYIEALRIPRLRGHQRLRVDKVSKRRDDDISAVCLALRLDLDEAGIVADARLACGGMAATPLRGAKTEAALRGRPFDAAAVAAAQAAIALDFQPIDDLRASAAYRLKVAQNLLQRALLEGSECPAEVRHA